jgi:pilus assembly protein Flp/PilA
MTELGYQTYVRALALIAGVTDRKDSDRGATAVEYGLMVALIAVAIIVTVTALGLALDARFETVRAAVAGA